MEFLPISITRISGQEQREREDVVAVEARYTVRSEQFPSFSFTCTPAHLEEMVLGALYSRKHISAPEQVSAIEPEGSDIAVTLRDCAAPDPVPAAAVELDPALIFRTVAAVFSDPDTLFNRTGCAHSCSLLYQGKLLCTMEDIGRHNALDKVIGYALRNHIPLNRCVVFTSGRISGDYMEKIIHAGFPAAVSRAAVTSEAVRLAKAHGVTLYGFVRGNSANRYS